MTRKAKRTHVWQVWAWFRIEALNACLSRPRMTSELCDDLQVSRDENARRVALRNLGNMVRDGFLVRGDDGYRATERGVRVLADIELLASIEGGRRMNTRRVRKFDHLRNEVPVTRAGLAALQPHPMTPEQIKDLVARSRAAEIAVRQAADRSRRRVQPQADSDAEARQRYQCLTGKQR